MRADAVGRPSREQGLGSARGGGDTTGRRSPDGASSLAMRVGSIGWSENEVTASFRIGRRDHPVAFRATVPMVSSGDAFLPLALLPAMWLNASLTLEGEVSARLLKGAARAQDIFHVWDPRFRKTEIAAAARHGSATRGRGAACFFSGGVDSFYTLRKHRDEISHLIFVRGFDLPPHADLPVSREATDMARHVAAELGKPLIEVETDIRSFCDEYVHWNLYHGVALAAVALLLQGHFHTVYVPASHSYAQLFPWGTHPLLDHLWSTEDTRLVHDGCEAARVDKVGAVSSDAVAMRWLRVCWENRGQEYNCGRCEKCLRTMVSLRAHGALGRCATLPEKIDNRAVSRMVVEPDAMIYVEENLAALRRLGEDRALARALVSAMRRSRRRSIARALKRRAPAPLRRLAGALR